MAKIKVSFLGCMISVLLVTWPLWAEAKYGFAMTNDQIRQEVILKSINDFNKLSKESKTCACPYSAGYDGQSCGGQSAYFRQNQESVGVDFVLKCYPRDVTEDDIIQFRLEHDIPDRPLNPR